MAAKPDSEKPTGGRNALPFEPTKSRKQTEKKQAEKSTKEKSAAPKTTPVKSEKSASKSASKKPATLSQSAIPEAVSKRMVKRMALYSGLPTFLGMVTFVVSYWIVSHDWYELPTVAVLLVSLGFFGLGVIGLSYGVLSTSWDENRPGGIVGFSEFKTNFSRMVQAWRSQRNQSS